MLQKLNQVGHGGVGVDFLSQVFHDDSPESGNHENPSIHTGLTSRQGDQLFFYFNPDGLPRDQIENVLKGYDGTAETQKVVEDRARAMVVANGQPIKELSQVSDIIADAGIEEESVVADTSGAKEPSIDLYLGSLRKNIRVATVNKFATAEGTMEQFREMNARKGMFEFDGTAMAGNEIISFMRAALDTNDTVHRMRAIVNGTLTYIPWSMEQGKSWEDSCLEAQHLGYAEPDIRADIGGMDVAYKGTGLIRANGHDINVADILKSVKPFRDYSHLSPAGIVEAMKKDNEYFQQLYKDNPDKVLRYLIEADFTKGAPVVSVGPQWLDMDDPMSQTTQTLNAFQAVTKYHGGETGIPYFKMAAGAGKEITAANLRQAVSRLRPSGIEQNV